MKKLLLFGLLALSACETPSRQNAGTSLQVKQTMPGIELKSPADTFEAWNGNYHIRVKMKNTGKHPYKYLQLDAVYFDGIGKEVARSTGSPGETLKPGDSCVVETAWMFPTKEQLPAKVVLSISNQ